jgi:thiamine biosynthesis lipoprotein
LMQEETGGLLDVSVGQLGSAVLGAVFWITIAAFMHPNAYGYLSWLFSIGMFVSILCLLGLEKTVIIFREREGILPAAVLIASLSSLFAALVLWKTVHWAAGASVVGFSLFSLSFHRELAEKNYTRCKWLWLGSKLLSITLGLVLYVLLGEVAYILVGFAVAHLLFSLSVLRSFRPATGGIGREEAVFAAGALGSNTVSGATQFADKIVIGSTFGMSVLAVYHLAYRIFVLLSVVSQIFFFYLLPRKSRGERTQRAERLAIILSAALSLSVFASAPVFVPRLFPEFSEGVQACQLAGLAVLPSTLSGIALSGLYGRKRSGSAFLAQLLGFVAGIAGMLTLGNVYGILGISSFILLTQTVTAASSLLALHQPPISPVRRRLLSGLAVMIILSTPAVTLAHLYGERLKISGNVVTETRLAMDTYVTITAIHENVALVREAIDAAFREISRIEDLMSEFSSGSEVYALNRGFGEWVPLSPETVFLLEKAKHYSEISGGCFDVTVKPLVDLWMVRTRETGREPSPGELENVKSLVCWQNIILTENAGRLASSGMMVTLGGIAKGYAVDRAGAVLLSRGVENFLVNIGGDLLARGTRRGEPWRVGIQDPRRPGRLLETISVENAAVATSGDYERFFFLGGRRIHHIIDPRTGYPADRLMSVTIIAPSCLDADALSTAVFVMGPEDGRKLIENLGLRALLLTSAGERIEVRWAQSARPA